MKCVTQLKAFTFLEVIFVILLSCIVVGSVFSVLVLSNKLYGDHMIRQESQNGYHMLRSVMDADWNCAKVIIGKSDNHFELYCINKKVDYVFINKEIIRICNELSDTFDIEPIDYSLTSIQKGVMSHVCLEMELGVGKDTIPMLLVNTSYKKSRFLKHDM